MNIFISNINKLNEDIENFVIVKSKIEKKFIEDNIIENKNTIQDYITSLNLENKIFMMNDKMNTTVPFNLFKTNINEICIVYCYPDDNEEIEKSLKLYLEKCKYNIDKLTKLNQLDVINGKLSDTPYFIINGDFYII